MAKTSPRYMRYVNRVRSELRRFPCTAALALFAATASPASAQDIAPAREMCLHGDKNQNAVALLRACTLLIEFSQHTPSDQALAHARRADVFMRQQAFPQALDDYDSAIALAPTMAQAFIGRAGVRNRMGHKRDLVRADYDEAIRLDPGNATAYGNRALLGGGDTDSVLADLDMAIRLDPAQAAYWNNRAFQFASGGDHALAVADFSRAIALKPNDPHYYTQRGKSYAELGENGRAVKDFTRAIALAPHVPVNHYSRGLAHERLGKREKAIADYREALRLLPSYTPARDNLCALTAQTTSAAPASAPPVCAQP